MKPSTSIIALAAGGVVAQNGVPPSCGDPIDQKLTSLIDAGDGARYLSGTHTPDCAINGTDQPFSPDQPSPGGGSNLQFHNETVSPDDFYCSKIYPSGYQPAVTTAEFLLCIASKNIPKTNAEFGNPSNAQNGDPNYSDCMTRNGGDQTKCRGISDGNGGMTYGTLGGSEMHMAPFPSISMDCRHVAEAANAMFGNCADLRDGSGAPLMGGVQPIDAQGLASGLPSSILVNSPTTKKHASSASPQNTTASGLFLVIKHS